MRILISFCFSVVFLFSWNVKAEQKALFWAENDTVLHICSNITEENFNLEEFNMEDWEDVFYVDHDTPFLFSTIVIDEGVDSVLFALPVDLIKSLEIPSTLRTLEIRVPLSPDFSVRLNPKNPYLCMENGRLYNREKTKLFFLASCRDSVFQLPETVDSVCFFSTCRFSKVILPKNLHSVNYIACDTLIVQSEHFSFSSGCHFSSLYCESDSAVASLLQERSWNDNQGYMKPNIDREDIHCSTFDVRKRDTSWMRDSYRIFRADRNDSLVEIDSIFRDEMRTFKSLEVEEIPKERLRIFTDGTVVQFYVATYDTFYCLPKTLRIVLRKDLSDFGELSDSVYTIREGLDTFPRLDRQLSFRKVIIPKSLRYFDSNIECDSVFIYSDSLTFRKSVCQQIFAEYYYLEHDQFYPSLKRLQKEMRGNKIEICCPNVDIRKRNMMLQKNKNTPIWRDSMGNMFENLTFRPLSTNTLLNVTIEGIDSNDLYVFSDEDYDEEGEEYDYEDYERTVFRKKLFERDGGLCVSSKNAYLRYAVWTYDTLLPLSQITPVRMLRQNGSKSEKNLYSDLDVCLFYVPKGETVKSLFNSKKRIKAWREGDKIPRRYLDRLAIGYLSSENECVLGEYDFVSRIYWKDNQNFLRPADCLGKDGILPLQQGCKEFWLYELGEYLAPKLPPSERGPGDHGWLFVEPTMHFYVK